MKNKILASLLAVCLFVGLAVPAFAISSQTGADSDITSAKFLAKEYTIKNNANKPLKDEVMAFAGKDKLVQEPTIEWTIENDDKFAFSISDDGTVYSSENAGTAKVTARLKDGTVVATAKVVAAKADPEKVVANGFTFESNSIKILTGAAVEATKNTEIVIVPTPANAYFTQAQYDAIAAKADSLIITIDGKTLKAPTATTKASNKVVFQYDLTEIQAILAAKTPAVSKSIEFKGDFPAPVPNDATRKVSVKRAASISTVAGLKASTMNASGTVKIEVGQKINVASYFKQGPSASNIKDTVVYDQGYTDNNAIYNDFAEVAQNGDVLGVAVGKNRITATANEKTASIIVEVVPAGSIKPVTPATINNAHPKMIVGKTLQLAIKDAPAGDLTWKSLDTDYVTVDAKTGLVTAVKATPAGKVAKVFAMVDGKDISLYSNITVVAVDSTNPADKPSVPPATGV